MGARKFLVPVRRRIELDLHGFGVGVELIPFSERVPAFCYYLNQDSALRKVGHLHGTVLIGFKVQFGELIVMKQAARLVESDINAGIADRLSIRSGDFDA